MSKAYQKFAGLILGCLVICGIFSSAMAQNGAHPVEGKYDVTATGEAIGTLTFQLIIKRDGDKWKAEIINSPQPLNVSKMMIDADNKLSLTADAGGTEVTMTAKFDNGKIDGNWTAGDANGKWTAVKLGESASSSGGAAAGATAALDGAYEGEIVADGQGALPIAFVIKKDGDKLTTENKGSGDITVNGIKVSGDSVTLNMAYQGNPFDISGKVTGSEMGGKWEAGGFSGTWKAKKK
ncbi:MAG TPA: hypothetical protein VNQ79_23955 [Blastocatellia bacterium]|nr:hypothetical protein [Blastocatellia bacterium]